MAHNSLCRSKQLKFNEIVPARILHVRIPGQDIPLDVISCYQHVWRAGEADTAKKESRNHLIRSSGNARGNIPRCSTLLVAGDFNMSLKTDHKHVGPCTLKRHRGSSVCRPC